MPALPAATPMESPSPRHGEAGKSARPELSLALRLPAAPLRPEASEIVYVLRDFQLLDPESYQRTYRRHDARALAKGYYIVSWPPGKDSGTYGEDASFLGPFKHRRDAEPHLRALRQRPGQCPNCPQHG